MADGGGLATGLGESVAGLATAAGGAARTGQQQAQSEHASAPTTMPYRKSVPVEPVTW